MAVSVRSSVWIYTIENVFGVCRAEFSQPLSCLYQAMQIQEKSFLLLSQINFPEKETQNSLLWH